MKRLLALVIGIMVSQIHAAEIGESRVTAKDSSESASGSLHIIPTVGLAAMAIKSNTTDWDADNGLSVGGIAEMGSGMATFQTGLLYNQFRGKWTSSGIDFKLNLTYLSIPLLAKFNLMRNPERTVYIKSGLMPGFIVSKQAKWSGDGLSGTTSDLNVNTFDIPAVLGLGGAIPMSAGNSFIIEANYLRGLTKVNSSGDSNFRNEGFIVGAGFSISI